MKFTNGYWMLRDEIEASYAVEYAKHTVNGNKLEVYLPAKHMSGRGDALNIALLTLTLSSPQEGVIKVSAVHHKGMPYKGPFAAVKNENPNVTIEDTEDQLIYKSGTLKAVIDKAPNAYKLAFYEGDTFLTESSFRNLAYMHNRETGKNYMVEQLLLDVGEYVYGLGERFTPFVKNGQIVEMWNEDGGTASEIAYKNIPFYITNKGYGVLVDNEGDVAYEIGSEKVERVQFSVESERLDYYFISGKTPMGTVEKYTELTGKPALPPAWSFGLWLTTSFTTDYDENTTSSFIQGMADRDIPLHVFHFDCYWMERFKWCNFQWDHEVTTDPKGMLKRYHDKGLKICVWINPYIAQGTNFFKEGLKNGYLVQRADGRGIKQIDNWQPGMGLVDFTNPDAVKWYQNKLKTLLDMGVDCFKTDFGERIPVDVKYYDGSDPVSMHNYYTYLYNKAVFDLLKEVKGEGEAILFARSATAGGQQFPVHWGGDCSATYASMAESLRGGLSFTLSGFSFWSHDMGGFEMTAAPDVYKRWLQFGLLSTHSRLHGSKSYRVPWLFDEEAVDVCRKFTKLKLRLLPYLYSMAVKSHKTGIPSMRAMIMEFNDDPATKYLDMQYMLGDSILVAPIFNKEGHAEYYLPAGKWTHLLSGEVKEGGRWYEEDYDFFSLPVFVRENTLLPIGAVDTTVDYELEKDVQIQVYELNGKGSCKVVTRKGEDAFTVNAVKEGNKLTLEASRENPGITYLLRNIHEVSSVAGGSVVKDTEDGIILAPEGCKIEVVY